MTPPIHLRETSSSNVKPAPNAARVSAPFSYSPSDDGTDENLLILLHGLGDSHVPFAKLGRALKLPQTATLALRAPQQVPFLYEQSFQWYESFNPLGELIDRPNPTPALDLLDQLITECAWPPHRIHLLGFAQGGSVAVEFAIRWWTRELTRAKSASSSDTDEGTEPRRLGSVITVSGPLLSYPTLSKPCPTPTLVFHRQPPADDALPPGALTAFNKAFTHLNEVKMQRGEGMPRSKEEWEPIMRFWSEHLGRRQVGEGLYEVMSGGVP